MPISISLGEDFYNEDRSRGLYTIGIADTPLQAEGYDHFGDIDMRDDGYLCAPLEGGRVPAIAIFYSSPGVGDFHYVGKFYLNDQQRAGWCAFNPVNGYLYSSGWPSVDNPIYKYDIEINFDPDVCVEDVPDTCVGDVSAEQVGRLYLQSGQSIWNRLPVYGSDGAWELRQMQGGAFSPRGHLYLVNGYRDGFNRHKGGIWVFEIEETGPGLELGTLVNHSNQEDEPGTFKFEFHPGDYDSSRDEEPEGVDIWDLDQYPAFSLTPLSGQIHVIMIDNYPFGDPEGDDLFFKHYTVLHEDKCKI